MAADGGTLRAAVVCEARADQQTACLLADRVAVETIDWLEREYLDGSRRWCGETDAFSHITWTGIGDIAERHGISVHPLTWGSAKRSASDANMARRALIVLGRLHSQLDAVLLIRDSDKDDERVRGLQQARDWWAGVHGGRAPVVVIGVAKTKRECWLLAAFEPADGKEQDQLAGLRKELGFNPCTDSQELTAQEETAKRSAKRVAAILCSGDEERGLRETALETLKQRGGKNGLAGYLAELETRYVPLFPAKTQ